MDLISNATDCLKRERERGKFLMGVGEKQEEEEENREEELSSPH